MPVYKVGESEMTPKHPKIYHIVHVDRLESIVRDGFLRSDFKASNLPGTTIGMAHIKERRKRNELTSHPGLKVGACVPFYFCPRSIMLFRIYCRGDSDLAYRGGQEPIIHLRADLRKTVEWADRQELRWAFTLSNAGSGYFEDRKDLDELDEIQWSSVLARDWRGDVKEGKQAEFLVEDQFPWELVEGIGVFSEQVAEQALDILRNTRSERPVAVFKDWYY